MKPFSSLFARGIGFLIILASFAACKKEVITPANPKLSEGLKQNSEGENLRVTGLSQTKTASRFNDWPARTYVNAYSQGGAQYVANDDNSYAFTNTLTTKRFYASLVLQGFGFTIPSNATVENILVSVRRFKTGKASIHDYFATMVISPVMPGSLFNPFGVHWTYPDNYPSTEAEFIYTQSGTGNNAGFEANQYYNWTPGMVNDPKFGVRIDVFPPEGGSVVVYYDLVQIKVEYSTP